MTGPPITVVIGEDSPPMRNALRTLIDQEDGLDLVGTGDDAASVVALCARLDPVVAVVDVKMPRGGGVAATRGIVALGGRTRVIGYSAHTDEHTQKVMSAAGAGALIAKGGPIEDLVAAIRAAAGRT